MQVAFVLQSSPEQHPPQRLIYDSLSNTRGCNACDMVVTAFAPSESNGIKTSRSHAVMVILLGPRHLQIGCSETKVCQEVQVSIYREHKSARSIDIIHDNHISPNPPIVMQNHPTKHDSTAQLVNAPIVPGTNQPVGQRIRRQ
jgi:hypothetical protein